MGRDPRQLKVGETVCVGSLVDEGSLCKQCVYFTEGSREGEVGRGCVMDIYRSREKQRERREEGRKDKGTNSIMYTHTDVWQNIKRCKTQCRHNERMKENTYIQSSSLEDIVHTSQQPPRHGQIHHRSTNSIRSSARYIPGLRERPKLSLMLPGHVFLCLPGALYIPGTERNAELQ